MPPRRENPEVARLVSKQLLDALPNIVSQVAAKLNANQSSNPEPRKPRECTYKSFRSCNPKEFHGTEGAAGLLTWIESMESVLYISKCSEINKVEYAASLLQGRALTWWNALVQARGREVANQLPWKEFKKLLKAEYCPRSELQKLEMELWNHKMKGDDIAAYTVRFHELANLVPHLVSPKEVRIERRTIGNFGAQTQTVNQRDKAKCNRCKYPHWGNYITCQRCHLGGQTAKDCWKRLCFDCGSPDHKRNVCPKRKHGANVGQA
ncbi:uncharacterized protein LOC112499851 [Cynara cardunculus var. scolymus]|uniref:uncharacterized protein LOC112499851 n=1 Tax=Cynara cardunculus var. scolymus TaxID=59895 RepID=UPI000D624D58|nr:uncharacterized protein LOC112499851 [Cynara cardunculus var. scolymus]